MTVIDRYKITITRFVEGDITASQFEVLYLDMFKKESKILPEEIFDVLNKLFLDIDAYCGDPNLRDYEDLDEQELRERARYALAKLT